MGAAVIPARVLKAWGVTPGAKLEIDTQVLSDGKKLPPDIPQDKTAQDFLNEFEDRFGMSSEEFFDKWQR